jgi:uncharacterized SAM-binding protein YcdF (DUF218 family)
MSDVVRLALSATGAICALIAAALWIWRRPHSRAARRFLLTVSAVYALAGTYAVPALAGRVLTAGYRPFTGADAPARHTALVVLGSGTLTVTGWDGSLSSMTEIEAARVLEAWRVFRLIAPELVITSGGLPYDDDLSQPSGVNMRNELVRLGVPAARIIVEDASRNTHEQSVIVAPMLRQHGIEQMVLVTSDTHMRRSLGAFRTQGWTAIPAIAPDPDAGAGWVDWLVPSYRGLELSGQVVHEFIGLPYYWVRGWWRS